MSALTLAVPSKGRLKDNTLEAFAAAGLAIHAPLDGRGYRGTMQGEADVEVTFLSAGEITRHLADGRVHLGVTGEDLVRENLADVDRDVAFEVPLGFGQADVVVAVPDAWIDVAGMADLDDVAAGFRARHGRRLRVATKYWALTQAFFADHGIAVYRIVESLGATEGAPAAGSADVIVDITTTGSTLAANHLKVLDDGVILHSQAQLLASRGAMWSDEAKRLRQRIVAGLAGLPASR